MPAIAGPQLSIPKSISSDFAAPFAGLATALGALPIDIEDVARIGAGETPVDPLPPLIAIDGSPRPETAPGPIPKEGTSKRGSGFERDMGLLHDLLDMHPTTFLREFNLSNKDFDWAHQSEPLSECPSMRDILASSEASKKALIFFAPAFKRLFARFATASTKYARAISYRSSEIATGRSRTAKTRTSKVPPPPERPSVEKPNELEFAMHRFLHGALLARTGQGDHLAKAERLFIESAALFAKVERFCAAAMMSELVSDTQLRKGRMPSTTRHDEATHWLNALEIIGQTPGLEVIRDRALNAAQYEPAGSGTLEAIFRGLTAYFADVGDKEESLKMLIRQTWAQLMKTEDLTPLPDTLVEALKKIKEPPPPSKLNMFDWFKVHNNLIVIGDRLKTDGRSQHAETAEALAQMAFGFAKEITTTEEVKKNGAPD